MLVRKRLFACKHTLTSTESSHKKKRLRFLRTFMKLWDSSAVQAVFWFDADGKMLS